MADQEKIRKILEPIISYLDQCPTGEFISSQWKCPDYFELKRIDVNGVPVEHLVPKGKSNGKVILHIHGGGFLYTYVDSYREASCMYSKAAGGAEIYSVDYRVANKYRYPSANEDCITVYKWLLANGIAGRDIILAGDSAGGNLVLSVTLQLKDEKADLPKAVAAISPWGNLGGKYKERKNNYESDIILGKYGMKIGGAAYNPIYWTDKDNFSDPYVSPVYGDYTGFPDLLLQAGSYELLLGDVRAVAEAAEKAGVNYKFTIYDEMSHDFQLLVAGIEETNQAWIELGQFFKDKFKI